MSYLSVNLNNLISAVKKSATSLDRDFSEIEKLQSSVKDYKTFVMNGYNKADRTLKSELSHLRPSFAFAEDDKPIPSGSYFVVNPISGFSNFVRGIPHFSMTAAICENSTILAAVVYNPARDELYFAEKGMGAYKEGFRSHERLRISGKKEISESLIATGNGFSHAGLIASVGGQRILGDSALDLAYVASGKCDAFVSADAKPTAIVAGMLLVKEAGGVVYDINQKDIRTEDIGSIISSGNLLAVNVGLSSKLHEILQK